MLSILVDSCKKEKKMQGEKNNNNVLPSGRDKYFFIQPVLCIQHFSHYDKMEKTASEGKKVIFLILAIKS